MPVTRNALEERKAERFDPILIEVVAVRVIHGRQLNRYSQYAPVMRQLEPIIRALVNPPVIDHIISGAPHLNFDSPQSKKTAYYLSEDRAKKEIRNLVEYYHGTDDKKFVRQMTNSCVGLVQTIVNSEEFREAFLP